MIEVVVERPEKVLVEKIKKVREKNKKVVRIVREIKKARVRVFRGDEWRIKRDLVLKEEKVYVLKNKELRLEVI